MANIKFIDPVKEIAGTLNKGENLHFRTRNGKTQAYIVKNPYKGPASQKQNDMRNNFAMVVKKANEILLDPLQKEEWLKRFNDYRKKVEKKTHAYKKTYSTLRGYIIATLSKNNTED